VGEDVIWHRPMVASRTPWRYRVNALTGAQTWKTRGAGAHQAALFVGSGPGAAVRVAFEPLARAPPGRPATALPMSAKA
jgi:hypothetical protein